MGEAADGISVAITGRDDEIGGLMETLSIAGKAPAIAENSEYMTAASGEVAGSCNSAEEDRRTRSVWLKQLLRQCESEEEFHTARSPPTWTEVETCVSSSAVGPSSAGLRDENQLLFQRILAAKSASKYQRSVESDGESERTLASRSEPPPHREDPAHEFSRLVKFKSPFFWDFGDRLGVGRRIGAGGQAGIYEALFDGQVTDFVLKVFRSDSSLADLQRRWATDMDHKIFKVGPKWTQSYANCCVITNGTLLKDGRFAFVMQRYWGDLRKVIDLQIMKDVKTHQNPPFPLSILVWIMRRIVLGMLVLYRHGILHRDLKAANLLLFHDAEKYIRGGKNEYNYLECDVADFETPEGVMGTGFWRAPEILHALKKKVKNIHLDPKIWTEKVDVYSYA